SITKEVSPEVSSMNITAVEAKSNAPPRVTTCVIQASNIVKDFGNVRALNGLSLCIPERVTYGLLGPNGSGKTTFIRMVAGRMRPRLSLACALVHQPKLLLLDEPTVGVDPQLRQTFWGYFRTLNAQGVTIVVSSHVMDEADRCDLLGLVRAGQLLAAGTPNE